MNVYYEKQNGQICNTGHLKSRIAMKNHRNDPIKKKNQKN